MSDLTLISADFDPELRTEISHEIASNAASNAGVKTPIDCKIYAMHMAVLL